MEIEASQEFISPCLQIIKNNKNFKTNYFILDFGGWGSSFKVWFLCVAQVVLELTL